MSTSTLLRQQLQSTLGDSFSIERELGGDGMSRVFVARDKSLRRDVVVKIIAPENAEGLSAERFAREVGPAARLQQANIVPLLSAGTSGTLPYHTRCRSSAASHSARGSPAEHGSPSPSRKTSSASTPRNPK